ncbi:hairy-related 5 [Notolabrus celidotus]|uniref:hairy-related 5 n=1 Tax=Notolabrus celidotus TaxID=1203425 RepID=UPI00148FCF95|nr:hairy-related 5 [Notolabrus celidotus]
MKALSSSPETPQKTMRRVSKPVMEKRRRERINHSLETLRLLMLENTEDERLKNPKVEKAEILETVVKFLKTGKDVQRGRRAIKRVMSREQGPTASRKQTYHSGMRSCLLRVSHFISSKSQDAEETDEDPDQTSFVHLEPRTNPSSNGHTYIPTPIGDPAALALQHPPLHHCSTSFSHPYHTPTTGFHCDTSKLLSPCAAITHSTDPVWRPWPQ